MRRNTLLFLSALPISFVLILFYFTTPFSVKRPGPDFSRNTRIRETAADSHIVQVPPQETGQKEEEKQGEDFQYSESVSRPEVRIQLLPGTVRYHSLPGTKGAKLLDVVVEGLPMEMELDTGADLVVFNSEAMQRLSRLKNVSFLRSDMHSTAGGVARAYVFRVSSMSVGSFTLSGVDSAYIPTCPVNLLGRSFLRNFVYTVNEEDETITFIPRAENISYNKGPDGKSGGSGWAEVDGVKYFYEDGKLVRE